MKKIEHKGYLFKIKFVGDAITPIYEFKMYKKKNFLFKEYLWKEIIHRNEIISYRKSCDTVINEYMKEMRRL